MLSLPWIIINFSFFIMISQTTTEELTLTLGCKPINSTCVSSTQCCTGLCLGKCTSRCRLLYSSCNPINNTCCRGLQCDNWQKKCCRPAGQRVLTPSECCSKTWKPNSNGQAGGICCSQHAGPCSSASDCCSSLEHCSNPQWPNICV